MGNKSISTMAISNEEQFSKYLNELLAPSSLSALFAIYLFKDLLHHAPAMQICDSLVKLLMGISFFSCKIIGTKQKQQIKPWT